MSAQHKTNVEQSRDILLSKMNGRKPKLAIILGSGLGGLGDRMTDTVKVAYRDLPGFPILGVEGHAGDVLIGQLSGVDVVAFKGRKHFYETDDAYPLKTLIRSIKAAGVDTLFVSNAAGSLRPQIKVSELMAITDHINYMGMNPLVGPNDDDFGPRFPPLSDAWDADLTEKLRKAAAITGAPLHEGVYMGFRGPSFETPAEIRMAQTMGADAVGMSSVPDCIIARHCGMKVVGCSCITNMGAGLSDEKLSHAHTLENAAIAARNFETLLAEFVKHL